MKLSELVWEEWPPIIGTFKDYKSQPLRRRKDKRSWRALKWAGGDFWLTVERNGVFYDADYTHLTMLELACLLADYIPANPQE